MASSAASPASPRSIDILVPPQDLPILEWLQINQS
jgi:hypothetical protein